MELIAEVGYKNAVFAVVFSVKMLSVFVFSPKWYIQLASTPHTHMDVHTYLHTYIHTYLHTYIRTQRANGHTIRMHTHAHTHTSYVHAHTHTHCSGEIICDHFFIHLLSCGAKKNVFLLLSV